MLQLNLNIMNNDTLCSFSNYLLNVVAWELKPENVRATEKMLQLQSVYSDFIDASIRQTYSTFNKPTMEADRKLIVCYKSFYYVLKSIAYFPDAEKKRVVGRIIRFIHHTPRQFERLHQIERRNTMAILLSLLERNGETALIRELAIEPWVEELQKAYAEFNKHFWDRINDVQKIRGTDSATKLREPLMDAVLRFYEYIYSASVIDDQSDWKRRCNLIESEYQDFRRAYKLRQIRKKNKKELAENKE